MPYTPGELAERSVVIYMTGAVCTQPAQVFQSPQAVHIIQKFIDHLRGHDDVDLALFEGMETEGYRGGPSEAALTLTRVLGLLCDLTPRDIRIKAPDVAPLVAEPAPLARLVEDLYDHWRGYERYLIFEGGADTSRDRALEGHLGFIQNNRDLNDLVRQAYRQIEHNLRGHWPRVYRQVPAGPNMSLLIDKVDWPCPPGAYQVLREIRMVRLGLMSPPVVLYPRANARKGRFEPVSFNPLERAILDPEKWLCLPVRVGRLNMLVYFDRDFLSHAVCLLNLFEMSGHNEARAKPDAILVFGVPRGALPDQPTVFYEDEGQDIVLGAIAKSEDVDYLGYFKKMLLTMHNVVAMRRSKLPVHGAMCRVQLREGPPRNIVIVGDSGAGKSETLEAFRQLADDNMRSMTIIFDDMGSIELSPEGKLVGYGTEIGAFVRLDDLDQGYAFGRIDRSIFINPHRQNARLVIPICEYEDVIAGHEVDMLLYANNYEPVDEEHGTLEFFTGPQEALDVFRQGYRAAKGTTDERGLVHTYFGNPFGPAQLQERHEPIAQRFFEAAFAGGVKVGQLRTRLGLKGWEREGPLEAARALFGEMREG